MKKIAIIRRNGLGDLICTLPLIHHLQNQGDEITLFVDERNAPLIPYLPHLGRVVVLPITGNKYMNHLKMALRYRWDHFDIGISAKTSPMKLTNFFLFALGAKQRIAYTNQEWHKIFINARIPFDWRKSRQTHQALKALQMVAPELTEIPTELYPKVRIPQQETMLIPSDQPILLISASTTRHASRLNETRYAALVNQLYNEVGPFYTLVLGQEKDQLRGEALAGQLKVPYRLHFPRNFEEFMLLLGKSDLCFVGDGGIGHIGAAMGKEAVVLFGETNPQEWKPLGSKVATFYDPIHVNRLKDETLYQTLASKMKEL